MLDDFDYKGPWPPATCDGSLAAGLREIYRQNGDGTETRVRMHQLRNGDKFRIDELPGYWTANTAGHLQPNHVGTIMATCCN